MKIALRDLGIEGIFPTDIGCYTLGLLPPLSVADYLLCMGSSVSTAAGISRATGQKVIAFIGDSTFFHSGIAGLVNAVHNRHDFLLVVLDNGTTAMTGHQPHPGVKPAPPGYGGDEHRHLKTWCRPWAWTRFRWSTLAIPPDPGGSEKGAQ